MQKNDFIELVIEDISTEGAGIGKYDGMTFFVKDAIIGDRILAKIIKLKKTYGYARLMEIKEASPIGWSPVVFMPVPVAAARSRKWTIRASWNLSSGKYGEI